MNFMRTLSVIGLIFVTGLAIGAIGIVSWTDSDSSFVGVDDNAAAQAFSVPAPSADQIAQNPQLIIQMYDSLTAIVNEERNERLRLEEDLIRVTAELKDLESNLAARVSESYASQQVDSAAGSGFAVSSASLNGSIEQRLIDAGFDPMTAADLQRRMDAQQMDQLYLRDRATREGWINTRRFRREASNLRNSQDSMRAELSDTDYDKFLFATGQPNRVGVASVLATSPARKAGLQSGDTLLSYDGEQLFNIRQLIDVSARGDAGQTVVLEVLRDGQKTAVYIPRGPLGFNPNIMSVDPGS
jgi:hypothetical protein